MVEARLAVQKQIPRGLFSTPVPFSVAVGAGTEKIYTGKPDQLFLVRSLCVHNPTTGGIAVAIQTGSNQVFSETIAAGAAIPVDVMSGLLLNVGLDIDATGSGVRIFGWGLRIVGGDAWAL